MADENIPKVELNYDPQTKAKNAVVEYFNSRVHRADDAIIGVENVYVVWFAFTLGNWKCLLSTSVPDGMYYECTYNREKKEMYLDAYKKFDNISIPD